jgi:hypothetical protein
METWKTFITFSSFSGLEKSLFRSAIGDFGIAMDFRNWLAHGRYWEIKRSLSDFEPQSMASMLENLSNSLSTIASRLGLMNFPAI